MKRALFLVALMLVSALPALAQSTELGVVVGASRRFVENGEKQAGVEWLDSSFSLSNNSVDLYYSKELDEDTFLKLKIGRIETQIAEEYQLENDPKLYRRDAEGEVQHAGFAVEYRFSEPYGTTGIFAGAGFYRTSGEGIASKNGFGVNFGANVDLPITPMYGVLVEGTYHWTRGDFRPKYLTIGVGLRARF